MYAQDMATFAMQQAGIKGHAWIRSKRGLVIRFAVDIEQPENRYHHIERTMGIPHDTGVCTRRYCYRGCGYVVCEIEIRSDRENRERQMAGVDMEWVDIGGRHGGGGTAYVKIEVQRLDTGVRGLVAKWTQRVERVQYPLSLESADCGWTGEYGEAALDMSEIDTLVRDTADMVQQAIERREHIVM